MKKTAIIVFILALICASGAFGQIPKTINYQGVLTDDTGTVVPDGSYTLTLRLYTVSSGGSPIWECAEDVTVTKGIFNAVLGQSCALTPQFGQLYYLGVSVDGGPELAPRTALTSAAYSMSALSVAGLDNIFPESGNVGIGTTTPGKKLTVEDTNQVGIQYNGLNGSWASIYINAVDAGSRPTYGWMRQNILRASAYLSPSDTWHLRFNGTDRFNVTDDGRVGIDMAAGLEKLSVAGAVQLGNSAGNTTGAIRWTGADFEGYTGSAWESFTAGGSGSLPAGTSGQTLRHNGSAWVANNSIHNNGTYVGIGTVTPEAKLNVGGGQWDLTSTEGDFKIGDSTYRLKFGVATGGGGAGSAGIRVAGGAERLLLGAGENEVLELDNTGKVKVGSVDHGGNIDIHRAGLDSAVVRLTHDQYGGKFNFYDEFNNSTMYGGADASGTGGRLYINRNTSSWGFYVEGNWSGTEEPGMGITGSTRSAVFRMDQPDDDSVLLPVNAISSSEILNETGAASNGSNTILSIGSDITTILSRSISAPAAGYALVIATGQIGATHTNGSSTYANFGVSDVSTSLPLNQDIAVGLNSTVPSGIYYFPGTVHGLFSVSEGVNTFYFLGDDLGDGTRFECADPQLTVVYIPTTYGMVVPTLATGYNDYDAGLTPRPGLSASEIAEEKTQSENADRDRVLRELEAMRERIADLEQEMANER